MTRRLTTKGLKRPERARDVGSPGEVMARSITLIRG
jgi:hypothetical protein